MKLSLMAGLAAVLSAPAFLHASDFRNATIVVESGSSKPQQKAATMLAEEIETRTQLRLKIANARVPDQPAFILRRATSGAPESLTLTSTTEGAPTATVACNDERAAR